MNGDANRDAVAFTDAEKVRLGFLAWRCERGDFATDQEPVEPLGLPRPIEPRPTFPVATIPEHHGTSG